MDIKKSPTAAPKLPVDFAGANADGVSAPPAKILEAIRRQGQRPIITTNFRPLSIALVHLANRILPGVPVIWIDHGYNTRDTLAFVAQVTTEFELNLQVYHPAGRSAAAPAGIPPPDTPEHARFTRRVKLEPFSRALAHWQPDFWITGIRSEQTEFRRSLGVFSPGPQQTIRAAPFFHWTEIDVEGYIYEHALPDYTDYFDPTKPATDRECGLQALA